MPIKALLLTFLTFFAGFLLTSEAIGQVGLLLLDKPAATKEDINGMRGLIKKEFSAQGALLKNEDEALGQLKTQINILNKSLDAIEAQASVNLNHLRLSNGLGVGLLLLQMLGLWLLKRHGGTTVKMPSNDIGSNNFTVDFKRSKTILQPKPGGLDAGSHPATTEDRNPATDTNSGNLTNHLVSISNIKIERAAQLFGGILTGENIPQSSTRNAYIDLSTFLVEAKKMKLQALEKVKGVAVKRAPQQASLILSSRFKRTSVLG